MWKGQLRNTISYNKQRRTGWTCRILMGAILLAVFFTCQAIGAVPQASGSGPTTGEAPVKRQAAATSSEVSAELKPDKEPSVSQTVKKPVESPELENLHAISDKMIFDSAEHYAELIGNVKVTQGKTVITSDTLRIYYRKKSQANAPEMPGDDTIEKIIATGNVRIELETGVAISDKAVYHSDRKILVLTGLSDSSAKFVRGDNTISGSKITVNRENGQVTFESSSEKPVEAFIFSDEKL